MHCVLSVSLSAMFERFGSRVGCAAARGNGGSVQGIRRRWGLCESWHLSATFVTDACSIPIGNLKVIFVGREG